MKTKLKVTDFWANGRPFYVIAAPAEARTVSAVEACELALSVWKRTGHTGIHHRGFIVEVIPEQTRMQSAYEDAIQSSRKAKR